MLKVRLSSLEKRMIRAGGVVVSVFAVVAICYAAQVPHTFTPSAVAKSSEVNANFDYLAARSWELGTGGIYHDGNVGIGNASPAVKLDVAGAIKPGSDGVSVGGACTSEGSFAYDMAAHSPVYCNNSLMWAVIGGAPSGAVTGGCTFGVPWGTATNCGLSAGTVCAAGHSARSFNYCAPSGVCAWNGGGTYAIGICIRN